MKKQILQLGLLLLLVRSAYGQCNPDTIPPELTLLPFNHLTFGPSGNLAFFATDFIESVSDNCTTSNQIQIQIRQIAPEIGCLPFNNISPWEAWIGLSCGIAFQSAPTIIQIRAIDSSGNERIAALNITFDPGPCDPSEFAYAEACALNEAGMPIEGTTWHAVMPNHYFNYVSIGPCLSGDVKPYFYMGSPVVIKASKDTLPLNGVSTYDLVLISKHILGLDTLDSPYKYIAADVNHSNSITTFDIVAARKVLLGITDTFPNSQSWRFVPADFSFDAANPFSVDIPDRILIDENTPGSCFPFIGVKIGDVNNSASVSDLHAQADVRGNHVVFLKNQKLTSGETIEVPVYFEKINDLLGYQMALRYDPKQIEIENLRTELPGEFDYNDDGNGLLRLLWFAPTNVSGDNLFTIKAKALRTGSLLDAISLDEQVLNPELYTENAQYQLRAIFTQNQKEIGALQPNPVVGSYVFLPLELGNPGPVRIYFFDPMGREIYRFEQEADAGTQVLEIPIKHLNGDWLIYQIQAGGKNAVGKLVLTGPK